MACKKDIYLNTDKMIFGRFIKPKTAGVVVDRYIAPL